MRLDHLLSKEEQVKVVLLFSQAMQVGRKIPDGELAHRDGMIPDNL